MYVLNFYIKNVKEIFYHDNREICTEVAFKKVNNLLDPLKIKKCNLQFPVDYYSNKNGKMKLNKKYKNNEILLNEFRNSTYHDVYWDFDIIKKNKN